MTSKRAIGFVAIATSVLLLFFGSTHGTQATNEIALTPEQEFKVRSQNSSIRFTANGTYEKAFTESGSWKFINLNFTDFPRQGELNLTASTHNCDVAITSYRSVTSNTTLGSMRLRYVVIGQGTQSFNFGAVPEGGMWSVIINGEFVGREDHWTVSAETTVTVTGAASNSNVSIIYYVYPESFANLANQGFLERNSVAIATAIALTITVGIAVAAKKMAPKPGEDNHSPIQREIDLEEKQ